ncbi:MAG: F0F1 ATP synthase subunit alpha, partial [Bacteroidales bacterium]
AQFRELESFSKFGSDLDLSTQLALNKGRHNVELLKQPQYSPMKVEDQVAVLYCGVNGLLLSLPLEKVAFFEKEYLNLLHKEHASIMEKIAHGEMNEEIGLELEKVAKEMVNTMAV